MRMKDVSTPRSYGWNDSDDLTPWKDSRSDDTYNGGTVRVQVPLGAVLLGLLAVGLIAAAASSPPPTPVAASKYPYAALPGPYEPPVFQHPAGKPVPRAPQRRGISDAVLLAGILANFVLLGFIALYLLLGAPPGGTHGVSANAAAPEVPRRSAQESKRTGGQR